MYKWNGDNKLCIPGMGKIHPGGTFELDDENLKNPGVKHLMKQGLITEVVQPEPADTHATAQPLGEKASVPLDLASEIAQSGPSAEIPEGSREETLGDAPTIPGEETEALKPDPVKPSQKKQRGR